MRIKNVQILFLFNSKVTELSNSKWKTIYMNKSRRNGKYECWARNLIRYSRTSEKRDDSISNRWKCRFRFARKRVESERHETVCAHETRYRRWNSTVLHPRLLDTIVSHRYPPSSVSNRQPLVAPSPQPSFIGNRMKGFTSETLRFSRLEEHGFPPFLGSPFWQVWQGCTGNTDKLDGIKFLPLEKYRVRWFVGGIFFWKSRGDPSLSQVTNDHWI